MFVFKVSSGDSNSGPYTCTVGTVSPKLYSQHSPNLPMLVADVSGVQHSVRENCESKGQEFDFEEALGESSSNLNSPGTIIGK